jgi:hypothetical protein
LTLWIHFREGERTRQRHGRQSPSPGYLLYNSCFFQSARPITPVFRGC